MHLQSFMLKGGNIRSFVDMDYMPMETYRYLSEPNEPKEVVFRAMLEPFISDMAAGLAGRITSLQADILTLTHVYDLDDEIIATELDSSRSTVVRQREKAHISLKEVFGGNL